MKKKYLTTLLAALTAGSVLLLSGCSVDLTTINTGDTDISAELETENLSDGTIRVHSVWYSADGSKLSAASVTLSSEDGELFSGMTDDSGILEECTLPGNTTINCEIADSSGEVIAEAEIIFKLSSDYTDLTIYKTDSEAEENLCILEIPTDKTDIRAAIFVTEDSSLSFANLTPCTESDEETEDTQDTSGSEGDGTASEADAATTTEDDAATTTEGDAATTTEGDTATTTEGDTADGGDSTAADDGGTTEDTAAQ